MAAITNNAPGVTLNLPKTSKGFNLDSLLTTQGLLQQYSTVQIRNGNQNVLLSRAADAGTSGYITSLTGGSNPLNPPAPATPVGGNTAPDLPIVLNSNGVVRLQGQQEQISLANQETNLAAKQAANAPKLTSNPLIIVGVVGVLGIAALFIIKR